MYSQKESVEKLYNLQKNNLSFKILKDTSPAVSTQSSQLFSPTQVKLEINLAGFFRRNITPSKKIT